MIPHKALKCLRKVAQPDHLDCIVKTAVAENLLQEVDW